MLVRDKVCSFDVLYESMLKCRRGVMWKDSVARYVNDPLVNTNKLRHSLLAGTYSIDDYFYFIIYEPKVRGIVSTGYKDRVFQRSLCDNYLYDALTKDFIYDNGACQIGKGTDFTRNRLKAHLSRFYRKYGVDGYVLNCDLKNFFGSTLHSTAKAAADKRVDDEWALQHVYQIIDSYDDGNKRGLGLGSQITQLVQLVVLSDLDHKIKERLGIAYYSRYMDDLVLIHPSKKHLQKCLTIIEEELLRLGLTLNEDKTKLFPIKQGIKFLGFKFELARTGKVLMFLPKQGITKAKRKIRKHQQLVITGAMEKDKMFHCYESRRAHISKGDSYCLLKTLDKYFLNAWGN